MANSDRMAKNEKGEEVRVRALWHSKIQWRLWFFIFIFIFILGLGDFRSKWRIGGVWGGGFFSFGFWIRPS